MNKSFIFFIALLPIIFTVCPDFPTIPTTSPKLITSASAGIEHFPLTPTQQFSVTMFIKLEEACPTGGIFNLFSMTLTPPGGGSGEDFTAYFDCSAGLLLFKGSIIGGTVTPTPNPSFGTIAIFLSFDLNIRSMTHVLRSETFQNSNTRPLIPTTAVLDSNSKFYLCADKDGASISACTVSRFVLEYQYYALAERYDHLDGDPTIAAFYSLSDKSLESSIRSASPAYFGDQATNPTAATTPTWDSSNNFVAISAGQFLTFPLPDITSTLPTISTSFSFSAWVKILTEIPAATTTIFSMYSSTGDQVGYSLRVSQSSKQLSIIFKLPTSEVIAFTGGTAVSVELDQWQLIGFSASASTDKKNVAGTIFCGTSSNLFQRGLQPTVEDLSTASVIRIGDASDSFNGQVSGVRITTHGGGFVRNSNLCSSQNSLELGVGSFALACSGNNALNSFDNKCYSGCPTGTYLSSDTAVPICVDHCATRDSTKCLSCGPNYFLSQGACVNPCPGRTYQDNSICTDCSNHCAECDAGGCRTCDNGYELNASKECVSSSNPSAPTTTEEAGSSSSSSSSSSPSGGGLSGGAIAGIVGGSVAILTFVGWSLYSFKTRKFPFSRKSTTKNPYIGNKSPATIGASNPVSPTHTEENPLVP